MMRRSLSFKNRFLVLTRDGCRCRTCGYNGQEDPSTLHVDHVVPVCHGGGNGMENLQTLCIPCHKTKSSADAKHVELRIPRVNRKKPLIWCSVAIYRSDKPYLLDLQNALEEQWGTRPNRAVTHAYAIRAGLVVGKLMEALEFYTRDGDLRAEEEHLGFSPAWAALELARKELEGAQR